VCENRVLRRIFGTMVDKLKGEIYIMKNFIICTGIMRIIESRERLYG
jgi:hypothetical protein